LQTFKNEIHLYLSVIQMISYPGFRRSLEVHRCLRADISFIVTVCTVL